MHMKIKKGFESLLLVVLMHNVAVIKCNLSHIHVCAFYAIECSDFKNLDNFLIVSENGFVFFPFF